MKLLIFFFFFASRRRHTSCGRDWSADVCSSDLRTQAYGETKYKKENPQVLDRTKALHGPRTQAYGETKYKRENLISFGQNQGLAWSTDSSLLGNQVQKRKSHKFWTEPRPCMVLGLKPMGKPSTKEKIS